MKRTIALAAVVCLTIPALAMAHVSVRPRESTPGSEERYTMRVPTEGGVNTTMVSVFRVRNAESARELLWKAHQHFADGKVVDWVGPAGDRRPAAVTKLVN